MRIVLASASPRRRELLGVMGVTDFEIIPATGEEPDYGELPPEERVAQIALAKARSVAAGLEGDCLVIGADTLVFMDGKALGKPHSGSEAEAMLEMLSGRDHTVATGVAVIRGGKELCETELTRVRFARLRSEEIKAYVATGESMDKAGAYGIQGRGSVLVEGIEGDYFNVMGLPIRRLYSMLGQFGLNIL